MDTENRLPERKRVGGLGQKGEEIKKFKLVVATIA